MMAKIDFTWSRGVKYRYTVSPDDDLVCEGWGQRPDGRRSAWTLDEAGSEFWERADALYPEWIDWLPEQ